MPEDENYPVDDRQSDFQMFPDELKPIDTPTEKKNDLLPNPPTEDEDEEEDEGIY